MKKDNSLYLKHIFASISRVEEYTHSIRYEDFISGNLIQDGVIRQLK